jgi:uncharacterized ion transporter superfamily protein YfcC
MKKIISVILILILGAALTYFIFECQFQTYRYKKQTDELNIKINELGCHDMANENSTELDELCPPLIQEHNKLIDEWMNLSCVAP